MGTTLILNNNNQFTVCVCSCVWAVKELEIAVLFPASCLTESLHLQPKGENVLPPVGTQGNGESLSALKAFSHGGDQSAAPRSLRSKQRSRRWCSYSPLFFSPRLGSAGAHSVSVTLAGCKLSEVRTAESWCRFFKVWRNWSMIHKVPQLAPPPASGPDVLEVALLLAQRR